MIVCDSLECKKRVQKTEVVSTCVETTLEGKIDWRDELEIKLPHIDPFSL